MSLFKNTKIRLFITGVVVLALLGVVAWWFLFRSFVSTNDARVATNILRVAAVNVGGLIEKVNVEEGSVVKKDQIIVEIDHRLAEAQYTRALAKYQLSSVELQRSQHMFNQGVVAQKELDTVQTNFKVADAELKLARLSLDNTYLKSPINGIVIQKVAEVGNLIEPGQVAVTIADVDNAWINANIEETSIARLRVGQPVRIKLDEGIDLSGKVQEILAATASQFSLLPAENAAGNFTKVVQKIPVKIKLDPHPNHLILRAGQSATVKIRTQ